jgi:HAD superfamily hydrolase (TIGR01549 family)
MSKYDYILLDWDGNLAKTLDIWLDIKREILERRSIRLSDEEIAKSFGAPREYFEIWGVRDIDAALEEMDVIAKNRLPGVELYPDALEVLEALKQGGKKMALVTTSLLENVQHILEGYDMLHYFDAIISNRDTERHKPHPEPLEKALELLGGTKEKAIMIGDSDKDLGAGLNAGIDTILFYPPEHKKFHNMDKLKEFKPTYIVEDFRKILEIV